MNDMVFKPMQAKNYSEIRSELAAKEAELRGCVVVKPEPNELFIDIDTEAHLETFETNRTVFERFEEIRRITMTPSPSLEPGHFHIRIKLGRNVRDARERILMQAVLGSDPMREILSLQRVGCGDENPTLFFEKKKDRTT